MSDNWDAVAYKVCLTAIKSLCNLALKELEKAKGEELPDDPETLNNLHALLHAINDHWESAQDEYRELNTIYQEAAKTDSN